MDRIAVVTTFNKKGYDLYGKRLITSFLENWPKEVRLNIFAEDFEIDKDLYSLDSFKQLLVFPMNGYGKCVGLREFKERWADKPIATGKHPDKLGYRYNAVRFAHKVYSVFHMKAVMTSTPAQFANVLYWMDGDTVCHSPLDLATLQEMLPRDKHLGFLGRDKKFTECGLYAMRMDNPYTLKFLAEFQKAYDNDEIFQMKEWHDSFVFDEIKNRVKKQYPDWQWVDWSEGVARTSLHPLINSKWGAYLDHLKGDDRKQMGRSKPSDFVIQRKEGYWK